MADQAALVARVVSISNILADLEDISNKDLVVQEVALEEVTRVVWVAVLEVLEDREAQAGQEVTMDTTERDSVNIML